VEGANDLTPATPTVDITVSTLGTSITGSAVGGVASKLNTGIASTLNASAGCNNANPCIALSTTDPGYAVNNLGTTAMGSAKTSGTAGGAALDFYQFVSNGSSLGKQTGVQFASSAGAATWTLSATGDLVYQVPGTSPVPLPAAVWLLGSGLLGLLGVGRRKVLAA
jgi:hypothetical protein